MLNDKIQTFNFIFSKIISLLGYIAGSITIFCIVVVTSIHMFNLTSKHKLKNLSSFIFPIKNTDQKILLFICIFTIAVTVLSWYEKFNNLYKIAFLSKLLKCFKLLNYSYIFILILFLSLRYINNINPIILNLATILFIIIRTVFVFTLAVFIVGPLFYLMFLA